LSEARAQDVKKNLLPTLLPGHEAVISKAIVNSKGQNGDGTSGECPYQIVNGKEVLRGDYAQGGSKRAELDQAKDVDIHVVFDGKWVDKITPNSQFVDGQCKVVAAACR